MRLVYDYLNFKVKNKAKKREPKRFSFLDNNLSDYY